MYRVFASCRLGHSELIRLFSLAPEGIPAANISVSTQRDSTRYRAGDLDELIDSLRDAHAVGDLDAWDNVMQVAQDSSADPDRRVSLTIGGERVEMRVTGRDETWVRGQAARIELFLRGTGGSRWSEPTTFLEDARDVVSSALSLVPFLAVLCSVSTLIDPDASAWSGWGTLRGNVAAFAGLAVAIGLSSLFTRVLGWANRAVLDVTGEVTHGSWWSRSSSTDKIALGGLVIAALSLGVTALSLATGR